MVKLKKFTTNSLFKKRAKLWGLNPCEIKGEIEKKLNV